MLIKQTGIWEWYSSTERLAYIFGWVSQTTADVILINRYPSTVASFFLSFFFNLLFINLHITH